MTDDILILAEHLNGKVADITFEMTGKARQLASALGGKAVAVLLGHGVKSLAESIGADAVLYVDDPALADFNPEAYSRVLAALIKERNPRLVMMGNTSMGMDLAAGLSVATDLPLIAYVNGLTAEDGTLVATSQIYGGKIQAEAVPNGEACIVSCLAGAFHAEAGRVGATLAVAPPVEQIASPVPIDDLKVKFVRLIEPEGGDVDITQQAMLVSIGRGIGGQENIELAQELADALGCAVSASRPITDAGWLPKTRQVGKSGLMVKPKVYLAFGISGAPEHLEGMRGAELIIAVNTDPKAPIFDVAHYGATCDILDLMPLLSEKIKG
ncbi:MAG TPA: electron transfer flavoprotein subunit alpha/FixB family protein [Anaerolineae bacterium]|nr:electron transfer flavoprotein subunit alpha/FixB family protein [Anaerolineae bacterium]